MTANHVFIPIQTCAYEIKYNAIYNCSKMAIFMFKSDKKHLYCSPTLPNADTKNQRRKYLEINLWMEFLT